MKPAVVRLVLCAALFVLWLGYLGFQVLTRPQTEEGWPLVLSRPQIVSSPTDVIADVPAPPAQGDVSVTVVEVLSGADAGLKEGDTIRVTNLEECRPLPRHAESVPPPDWSGKGRYLLPLRRLPGKPKDEARFEVVAIPPSPGFSVQGVVRIYPATAEALAQYRRIKPQ